MPCDAVDYIMDALPIGKRENEKANGDYHTKRVILEIYEEMAAPLKQTTPTLARYRVY